MEFLVIQAAQGKDNTAAIAIRQVSHLSFIIAEEDRADEARKSSIRM